MYKKIIIILVLLSVNYVELLAEEVILSCNGSSKSEFYYLDNPSQNEGYVEDKINITIIKKNNKLYVRGNVGDSEILSIGGNDPQFLERVAYGYTVLYTVHKNSVTIHKSYSMNGVSAMINIVVNCE